ncbi:hypothetical protein G7068_00005 [Leucobacter viscericola]|uniref:Uncharacterized protein n=1 Tax=Leucobacter viscericola TaxID=2714935 RepID=A0A6G7XBM6_9MICO|nr:hypothetical protein [Leucobacter viscericola]QIK61768.1 hypothetical protein G7068_00005 [Leucobacter viscericola]
MSNNTYWGTVPDQVEIIEPGEFEDNNGTTNDQPAIWMGEALIEGDLEVWKSFAYDLIEKINTIENRLHFGRALRPASALSSTSFTAKWRLRARVTLMTAMMMSCNQRMTSLRP